MFTEALQLTNARGVLVQNVTRPPASEVSSVQASVLAAADGAWKAAAGQGAASQCRDFIPKKKHATDRDRKSVV